MASLVALLPELLGGAEAAAPAAAAAEGSAAGGAAGGIMNFISKAGTIARQMNPIFQMASAFMPSPEHEPIRSSPYQSDFSY
jgi:hypothetical protein